MDKRRMRLPAAIPAVIIMVTTLIISLGMAGTASASNNWIDITESGYFFRPHGIAVDNSGNVYVADTGNGIKKLCSGSSTWTDITYNGDFFNPGGIAVDNSGNVYVADTNHNKIKKLCSGSSTWTDITDGYRFLNPEGIAVSSKFGYLCVADTGNNRVVESTGLGSSNLDWHIVVNKLWNPCGVAVNDYNPWDRKEALIADTSDHQIGRFFLNDVFQGDRFTLGNFCNFLQPCGVAADKFSNVYVADTGHWKIKKFVGRNDNEWLVWGGDGTWTDITGNGNFCPWGIAVDNSGNVYVADSLGNRIMELPYSVTATNEPSASVPIFDPTITPDGGAFATPQSVTISAPSVSQSVYYTTDGSDPTVSGSVYYTEPFTLTQSATVNAAVYDSVYGWSSVTSARFDIITPVANGNTVNINLSNSLTRGGLPAILDLASLLPQDSLTTNSSTSETINDNLDLTVGDSIHLYIPAGTTVSSSVYLGDLSVQQDEPLMLISPPPSNAAVFDFSFGGAGVTFSQPVTISIPAADPNAQAYYLDHGVWTNLGGTYSDGRLTFTVNHFSTFTTYDPPAGSIAFSPADGSTVSSGSAVTLTAPENSSKILYYFTSSLPTTFDISSATAIDGSAGSASPVAGDYLVAEFLDSNGVASQMFSARYNVHANTGGGNNNSSASTGSASVAPAAGGTVSLGGEASVTIPKGALNGSQNVTVNVQSVSSPPAPPAGDTIIGSYDFTVNGGGYSFNSPVKLTFRFDSSKLPAGTIPVAGYYDNTTKQWVLLQGTVSGDTIAVTVNHFTTFAVLAVPKTQPAPPVSAFNDVPSSYWAYDVISGLSSQGYINGYPDGIFKPGDGITRAEFISIMNKVLQLSPYTPAAPDFNDVSASDWFYQPVENAVSAGIAKGSDSSFMPDDPITREQMAVILMNALGQKTTETGINSRTGFPDDASISDWARGAVAAAGKDGLLKGYPDGSFKPQEGATRAEACAMIENFLKLYSPGK